MNIFKILSLISLVSIFSSCGSQVKNPTKPETEPEVVISRADNLSSRPEWLKETEPLKIENGNVYSLGSTTIPGDDRVDAGYRIAESSAKAGIASSIEQKLEFIFQNAEEGTQIGAEQARFIGAEATSLITSSLRPYKRYWEKVALTQDSGSRITQYRIFSSVSMPEADFKKAIIAAVRKAEGKKGLSKNFAEKVDKHWDKFNAEIPNSNPNPSN